jgi:hypothetical protein
VVLGAELDRPDRAFDGVRVDFDAAIVEEATEPLPVAQCVADRLGKRRLGRDARELGVEPRLQSVYQRPAVGLADAGPLLGWTAADARLDLVELGNPPQRLGRDRRAGGMVEIEELAADMGPAEGKFDRPSPLKPE